MRYEDLTEEERQFIDRMMDNVKNLWSKMKEVMSRVVEIVLEVTRNFIDELYVQKGITIRYIGKIPMRVQLCRSNIEVVKGEVK